MKSSEFWKQSAGSALVTVIRVVCAFVTNKFLAMVAGPVGFAAVGQLQNLLSLGHGTSSLALQNGWVSLTSRYRDNEKELGPIWRGGFRISVYASIATSIGFALFALLAPLESIFPLMPKRLVQAALLFAIPGMLALTLNAICQSVMNGLSNYRRWAVINSVTSVLNCVWVLMMVQTKSLTVLSAVATQSIVSCFFALWNAHRGGFRYKRFGAKLSANFQPWRGYAVMGLVPMILSPLVFMFVRSFLGKNFGWDAAGFWQGAMRISDFFVVAFSSMLGVVLLPRLSAAISREDFFKTLKNLLLRVMAIAAVLVLVLFFLRNFVVTLVLSEKFSPLAAWIPVQFIGDFFKVGCWCLGLALIARKQTLAYVSLEVGSSVLFFVLTVLGASVWEYRSPFVAYAIENALSFVVMLFCVRRIPWKNP